MKKLVIAALVAATGAVLSAAVPEISGVTMSQDISRLVTITYTLSEAPAVVTLDVQTNKTGAATSEESDWVSIGGVAVANAKGDVWKKVTSTSGTITWHPDLSWPDHKIADNAVRAVVTAWALDNTPDYMVVDLTATGGTDTQKYYPGIDYLPGSQPGQEGAITNNFDYRTTSLVMRKIMAKDVTWTMGTISVESQRIAERETPHKVTLTNNYYIGVFPVTQAQAAIVTNYAGIAINAVLNANPKVYGAYYDVEGAMRPVERISYNQIRLYTMAGNGNASVEQFGRSWPNEPDFESFLGKLRSMTGGEIDFDLPSEAQWEFAARAGNGTGYWGDGTPILNASTDANLGRIGRYTGNLPGGNVAKTAAPSEGGTPIVGSYAPNKWGLYDMQGCVWEWCLDWYQLDITSYNGRVNIGSAPNTTLGGTTMSDSSNNRVVRGGHFDGPAEQCRPGFRNTGYRPNTRSEVIGFRLVCTAGLK